MSTFTYKRNLISTLKVPPSIFASIFCFIITGIICLITGKADEIIEQRFVVFTIYSGISLNGLYFFIVEYDSELKYDSTRIFTKLPAKTRIKEWMLRLINQSILFLLWIPVSFVPEKGILILAVGLCILYILYIVWDLTTKSNEHNKVLWYIDWFGFIFSVVFLFMIIAILMKQYNISSCTPDLMTPISAQADYYLFFILTVALLGIIAPPLLGLLYILRSKYIKKYIIF